VGLAAALLAMGRRRAGRRLVGLRSPIGVPDAHHRRAVAMLARFRRHRIEELSIDAAVSADRHR
jgi:hypothetical protein